MSDVRVILISQHHSEPISIAVLVLDTGVKGRERIRKKRKEKKTRTV